MKRNQSAQRDIQQVIPIPSLNLFTRENLQMSIQSVNETEILPTGNWLHQNEIVFSLPGDPESFIDPNSIRLRISFKIVNGDLSNLPAGAPVATIANFGSSLFQQVAVRVGNSTQISGFDSNYAFISYLNNVLKAPTFYKGQVNFPYFLWQDTKNEFDSFTAQNTGYTERQRQVAGSIVNYLLVPIFSPITDQDRLLPPNISLQITLQRASHQFLIMSNAAVAQRNQVVQIESVSLLYQKIKINAGLHLNLVNALKQEAAIYPCIHTQTLEFSKTEGTRYIREVLFTDRALPSYVYLYILSTDRKAGNYQQSPFNMEWFNLNHIRLVSGTESYPAVKYEPSRRIRSRMYLDAMDALGSLNNPYGRTNGIEIDDYEGGYGIICFNLTKGNFPGYSRVKEPIKIGDLQAVMHFSQALNRTVSFLFLLEFPSNIYISSNIDISTDFLI